MLTASIAECQNALTPMRYNLEDGPNVTLLSFLHQLKHQSPNSTTLSGMLNDSIAVPTNASGPMRSKLGFGPNVTLLRLSHK